MVALLANLLFNSFDGLACVTNDCYDLRWHCVGAGGFCGLFSLLFGPVASE